MRKRVDARSASAWLHARRKFMLCATLGECISSAYRDRMPLGCTINSPFAPACMQACEMFILELTLRAWNAAEENKRRTLQRSDVAQAITRTDIFDFLVRKQAL